MLRTTYTVILHGAREALGISLEEYVLVDTVHHLSHQGWCTASRQYLSNCSGVHKRTVQRTIQKMVDAGLLEKNGSEHLRTTTKWTSAVTIARGDNLPPPQRQSATPTHDNPPSPHDNPPSNKESYKQEEDKLSKAKDFQPPTLEDVEQYMGVKILEKQLTGSVDSGTEAAKFHAYWTNCGWRMSAGKGAKMKDWRLAANTWLSNASTRGGGSKFGKREGPRAGPGPLKPTMSDLIKLPIQNNPTQ